MKYSIVAETALEMSPPASAWEQEWVTGLLIGLMEGHMTNEDTLNAIAPYVADPDLVMDEVRALLREVTRLDMIF